MPGPVASVARLVAPTGRLTGWSAAALVATGLSWTGAGAALVLYAMHGREPSSIAYWLMDVLSAVVYGAVTLVMLPRTRHPVVWIMLLVGVGCGVSGTVTQLLLLDPGPWDADGFALYMVGFLFWTPGTYATLAILPWLVTPDRADRADRVLRVLGVVGLVAAVVAIATLLTWEYEGSPGNPFYVSWGPWKQTVEAIHGWPDRFCLALSGLGTLRLAAVWWRGRASTTGSGYGWLAIGQLFMTAAFVPVFLVPLEDAGLELSGVSLILAQAFLPVALLVVVLRHQLWGVDLAVSRVTVWGLLTLTVLSGYAALAWLTGMLVPESEGVAGFLAVGLVVALSQPLRFAIQDRVDRLVYGAGADPVRLLGSLGRDLGDGRAATSLDALVDALREGLRLGGVEVRTADGALRARSQRVVDADLTLPLVVEGRLLGHLGVMAPPGQRIDPRTVRLVEQMAGVIAVALELSQVNDRLNAASDRLVEVRHEERRMLRRDLHDGMGPALAGVGLGLAAAQRRLTHDPGGTAALLAELEAEVERRTEDVRLMARALLPAQLDDGDLARALDVLAERFRASGLDVVAACSIEAPVSTRTQIAIYHVAAEALMNAYRHARATRVRIEVLAPVGAAVSLEVVDDGGGMSGGAGGADGGGAGVGLRSMRERSDELGGELVVGPRADGPGTRVRMVLP